MNLHPYFDYLINGKEKELQGLKQELVEKNVIYVGVNRFEKHFGKTEFIDLFFNQKDGAVDLIEVFLKIFHS